MRCPIPSSFIGYLKKSLVLPRAAPLVPPLAAVPLPLRFPFFSFTVGTPKGQGVEDGVVDIKSAGYERGELSQDQQRYRPTARVIGIEHLEHVP